MDENKLTYRDVEEYEKLFTLAPSFLLEMFARRNTNLVSKFKSTIMSFLGNLNDDQKYKLDLILTADIDELQGLMNEAYMKTNVKQYQILANPKYKHFIEDNLGEIRKML